jgi:hypothetical protein
VCVCVCVRACVCVCVLWIQHLIVPGLCLNVTTKEEVIIKVNSLIRKIILTKPVALQSGTQRHNRADIQSSLPPFHSERESERERKIHIFVQSVKFVF